MKTIYLTHKRNSEARQAVICLLVFLLIVSAIFTVNNLISFPAFNFCILFGAGYLSWTFTEYFMHRFWMHNNFKKINFKTYEMHMHHHKHPTDIKITGLQRAVSFLTGMVLLAGAIYLNNYFTIFVGFYFGFVFYTVLHVILHHRWGKYILPRVQIAHIHHHGKYPETGFSFSTILWDYLFGTMAPKGAEISEQMKNFYFKEDHHHS
jgi:sterol desaturase/sphingolipid hydroxylase (fatty acid hydroxylase superfamily)